MQYRIFQIVFLLSDLNLFDGLELIKDVKMTQWRHKKATLPIFSSL